MPMSLEHSNTFRYPEKVHPGDKVAILSPSAGLPEIFPEVYEAGLERLRSIFGLIPVEYPSTRKMHTPPAERARDIHAAFSDPEIKAIITSIGGEDQLKVLKYLDPEILRAHPKAFFGYSDNTNLHLYLWNLGLISYYGGSIMVHFGRGGGMHPYTVGALKRALFEHGEFELLPAEEYTDEENDWGDAQARSLKPVMHPGGGWRWHNAKGTVTGRSWGGCLEIIDWNLKANRYILDEQAYAGGVLYLETSEEMPTAVEVYRSLMCMGERGLLQQFAAILIGRPKATSLSSPHTHEEKERYTREQGEAIRQALDEYHQGVLCVFNLDFGHTDPQCIIPNGGLVKIDGDQQRIFVIY